MYCVEQLVDGDCGGWCGLFDHDNLVSFCGAERAADSDERSDRGYFVDGHGVVQRVHADAVHESYWFCGGVRCERDRLDVCVPDDVGWFIGDINQCSRRGDDVSVLLGVLCVE